MNKSSFLNNKFLDKSNIALICILGILVGFIVSRAALSISMFLLGVNALRDVPPRRWLQQKWWLLGVAWVVIYAITWFWTEDKGNWDMRLQVKLPFLLLPLAFAFMPAFSERQLRILTVAGAFILLFSACYSVSFLISDPDYYIAQYKFSHVLPTLPKRDHIRTSMSVTLFIIWCIYVWPQLQRSLRMVVGTCVILLVVYIHILAAKSGLVSLYIFFAGWSFYMLFVKKKLVGLIIILAVPTCVFLAMTYIPTFKERKDYIYYSILMLKSGDKSGNYGDVSRLLSYKIAVDLIKEHPMVGVGTGDMYNEMNKQYELLYPNIPPEGRLLPHNQFLIVALGCGIPAMFVFIIWVFMPLRLMGRNRQSFFFFMVWLILFIQLMIEPVLEVQLGVFLYLFFLLLQMHQLPSFLKRNSAASIA